MPRRSQRALVDALHCLPPEPEAVRLHVLEVAKQAVEAEAAVCYSLALLADRCHFVGALSTEPESRAALAADVEGRVAVNAAAILDPGARSSQLHCFQSSGGGAALPAGDDPLHRAIYLPLRVSDHARLLVYDGRRFVAWVGVLRAHGRRYGRSELARLDQLAALVTAALVQADRVERARLTPQLQLVVDVGGRISLASAAAQPWLTVRRVEAIARAVRAAASEGATGTTRLIAGAEASVLCLLGDSPSYLVTLAAPTAPELERDAMLTQRQREIAAHASAGLTRGEIAHLLSLSVETVRHHLKLVYEQLGVTSRVELANVLRTDD